MHYLKNFLLGAKLVFGSWISDPEFTIRPINITSAAAEIVTDLAQFESEFQYPFSSNETFSIKHGLAGDYFAFFKQLGKPEYFIARCKKNKTVTKIKDGKTITVTHKAGEIAAAACGIIREIKKRNGHIIRAWYICDLKVADKFQGEHIPLKMAQKLFASRFFKYPRGFAICMNPPDKNPKAARIFKKHGPIPGLTQQTLHLYSLSHAQINAHAKQIESELKKHGYMPENKQLSTVSTSGSKDYSIYNQTSKSSRPWHLLHLVPGQTRIEKNNKATYMICAVDQTPLDKAFRVILGEPTSTAEIISFGMSEVDFNFLTSNQI